MADEITQVFSTTAVMARPAERRLFARLDAIAIGDLIQLAARRPGRSSFSIDDGSETGLLFLEDGRLHAARFGTSTGLAALVRMLALVSGTFESAQRPWPDVGDVCLDTTHALLRAEAAREQLAPSPRPESSAHSASRGLRPPTGVRTADAIPLGGSVGQQRDPALSRFAQALHADGRAVGDALGLAAIASARITDERWILLLFHDAAASHLSVVLGSRRGASAGIDRVSAGAAHELCARLGAIIVFGSGPSGELSPAGEPASPSARNLTEAARRGELLLRRARRAGFAGTLLCEVLFSGRRLVFASSPLGSAGVLAPGDASPRALRALTLHLLPDSAQSTPR